MLSWDAGLFLEIDEMSRTCQNRRALLTWPLLGDCGLVPLLRSPLWDGRLSIALAALVRQEIVFVAPPHEFQRIIIQDTTRLVVVTVILQLTHEQLLGYLGGDSVSEGTLEFFFSWVKMSHERVYVHRLIHTAAGADAVLV